MRYEQKARLATWETRKMAEARKRQARIDKMVRRAQKAVVYNLLDSGVTDTEIIHVVLRSISKAPIAPMMVAGCKAAIVKGF